MKTVQFHGGPLNEDIRAIEYDDQQVFYCYVNMGEWTSKHTYLEDVANRNAFNHYAQECVFVIETEDADSEGTVIDLDGIEHKETVPICLNFGRDIKDVVGRGYVWVKEGQLWCKAELNIKHLDLYPAIGFEVVEWEETPTGKHYKRVKLFCIGVCNKENLNPSIKTISEQIKDQS